MAGVYGQLCLDLQGSSCRNGPPTPEPAGLCGEGLGFPLGAEATIRAGPAASVSWIGRTDGEGRGCLFNS